VFSSCACSAPIPPPRDERLSRRPKGRRLINLRAIKSRSLCSSVLVFLVGIFLAGASLDSFSAAEASEPSALGAGAAAVELLSPNSRNRYVRSVGIGAQRFCCLVVDSHRHRGNGVNLPGGHRIGARVRIRDLPCGQSSCRAYAQDLIFVSGGSARRANAYWATLRSRLLRCDHHQRRVVLNLAAQGMP
jgi:hypothetical protein